MLKVLEAGKEKDTLGHLDANALVDTLADTVAKRRAKPFATHTMQWATGYTFAGWDTR